MLQISDAEKQQILHRVCNVCRCHTNCCQKYKNLTCYADW